MNAGKFAEAEAALPAADQTPDPRIEIVRARIHAAAGDTDGAIAMLEGAGNRFPGYSPLHVYLGTFLWDACRLTEAETHFQQVLTDQHGNDLARSYLALCRFAAGDRASAAATWQRHGFSDNTMFRVRAAEFIEKAWLRDESYLGENAVRDTLISPTKLSTKKALSRFYRRDFPGMLEYLPEPPLVDDLAAFLAATAHEMLGHYTRARAYMEPLQGRRDEWPDPLVALHGRLLTREGKLKQAASEFSKVLIVGPEDYGVNYYLGIICLAYGMKAEARQYFLRAFTSYMVDTREFQWWQLEQVLLNSSGTEGAAPHQQS